MYRKQVYAIAFLSIVLVIFRINDPFYWDNIVQIAVPANWYADQGFGKIYLPNEITTGHQPFVGLYLALGWLVFGKSLVVSHLLFLPFVFGVAFQLLRLIRFFEKNEAKQNLILAICLLDGVLLSQLSLLTFEISHLFFMFWSLNSILNKNKYQLLISFIFLNLISLRANISAIALGLFYIYYLFFEEKDRKKTEIFFLVPGFLAFAIFLLTFYLDKGWIVHNTVSKSWENSSKPANVKVFIKNTFVIIWRFLDFGRWIFWLALLYFTILTFKKKKLEKKYRILLIFSLFQILGLTANIIPYQNSIAHRYLLPASIPTTLIMSIWIFNYFKFNWKTSAIFILFITISGYFYVFLYPEKIAKGWDGTPAHWPVYSLRNEMNDFLTDKKINKNLVGTSFPNAASFKNTELCICKEELKDLEIRKDSYVVFSNVFNETDEFYDNIYNTNSFILMKEYRSFGIYMRLYKRKSLQ